MEENPLHRAHALSAQASSLVKPPNVPVETLVKAKEIYQQATDLFEKSSEQIKGDEERKTLQLLVNQHKKLGRDVERRISTARRSSVNPPLVATSTTQTGNLGVGEGIPGPMRPSTSGARRVTSDGIPHLSPRREPVGLASAANIGTWPAATRLGVPPFSLRPSNFGQPYAAPRTTTSPPTGSPTQSLHTPGEPFSLSPLHSSSSSDESYLNLGAIPDTLDPFSRFWGMLENMLDDISNPVAFASAPLGIDAQMQPSSTARPDKAETEAVHRTAKGEKKRKEKESNRAASPSESFYVVHRDRPGPSSQVSIGTEDKVGGKTPEELALENENLRTSLDAIASHAEKLEQANKVLREQHDEMEKAMRSIAVGMRREVRQYRQPAQKVKQGQDVIRSQLLASVTHSPRSARMPNGGDTTAANLDAEAALRAKVKELEDQVAKLKSDNEKHKGQAEKYRDKLHQIKVNARAKRDAKLASGDGSSKGGGSTIDPRDPDEE